MVNVVNSIGFDLERVHTGLIVYLVDLWRSGNTEPLHTFFSKLCGDSGIDEKLADASDIRAEREHEKIDLVLFESDKPFVALEMKIHNHESRVPRKGSNREKFRYREALRRQRRILLLGDKLKRQTQPQSQPRTTQQSR